MTYRWGKEPDLQFDWKLSLGVYIGLALIVIGTVILFRAVLL
jgi:predicted Kef-type K+ transport protein